MPKEEAGVAEQHEQHPEQGRKKKKKSRFYRRFAQQDLRGWSPIISANGVVLYFLLVSVLCIALGIPVLLASLHVTEYKVRYDNTGPMAGLSPAAQQALLQQQGGAGLTTAVNLTITKTMNPPVRQGSSSQRPLHSPVAWLPQLPAGCAGRPRAGTPVTQGAHMPACSFTAA
jgi:hypothetical protein